MGDMYQAYGTGCKGQVVRLDYLFNPYYLIEVITETYNKIYPEGAPWNFIVLSVPLKLEGIQWIIVRSNT